MNDKTHLETESYQIFESYLGQQACDQHLRTIAEYRKRHTLPEINRPMKKRSLRYSVIDGEKIMEHLPEIWDLYCGGMCEHVNALTHRTVVPLENQQVGVNVNIMPPGRSEYRWHYDRTAITAILYLNEVQGGETVIYPNYRILLRDRRKLRAQRALDRLLQIGWVRQLFSRKQVVSPAAGRLVVMRGRRCWHSVRGVEGTQERMNIILAYDVPGADFPMEESLDSYLYTTKQQESSDPNYG
jgi:hypothetical protein